MKKICYLACLLALTTGAPSEAKKLYKFQDDSGRWHYTDRPPDDGRQAEVSQLRLAKRVQKVSVVRRGLESSPAFHIFNGYHGPIELELSLAGGSNIQVEPALPKRFVVAATSELRAVVMWPAESGKAITYDVRYRLMVGPPGAVHEPPMPYRVPFGVGEIYPVTQAFQGQFSHNEPSSLYAVDIGMPEGTNVHAARAGVVMDVAHDFFSGGTNPEKYMDRANIIRILHDDGTMAVYGHLALESARVAPGARVRRGQHIAQSGNTGFSVGPHLHFVVQRNAGMQLESLPFKFAGSNGVAMTPEAGTLLTSFPQAIGSSSE